MQVALGLSWETKVQHCLDCRDVETSSDEVCSEKEISVTALEFLNVCQSLILRQVAMDFDRL